jgi:hypothetical protein
VPATEDLSGVGPLTILALSILIPALWFFGRGVRESSGCLELGRHMKDGRRIAASSRWGKANRLALMFGAGTMAVDLLACHHCDNAWCIEPAHLYAGTFTDNNRDTIARKRRGLREVVMPKFTTWEEWERGGWRADGVPAIRDFEGVSDAEPVDLSLSALQRIDRETRLVSGMVESDGRMSNPDAWTEEDERSLMTLGVRDGVHDDAPTFTTALVFSRMEGRRVMVRVPMIRWQP